MVFRLENVFYEYGDKNQALADISLEIHPGEQFAILGANGSGKSTLLKLLAGLIFPTGGKIYAFDKLLNEATLRESTFRKTFRQKVGFVFQDSDVQLFCPTVWEEMIFAPLQLNLPEEETVKRAEDAMALLEITHLKNRTPYQLSGGEKKRVAIAATLTANPDVLLLDEPTSGLDPRTQKSLIELLRRLSIAGKTLVMSTNDLSILEDVCKRIMVLSEAHRFLASGETQEILSNTDLLLEANLIHEHLHRHGDDLHLHRHTHIPDHEHRHMRKNGRLAHYSVKIAELSCRNCVKLLEHFVISLDGVENACYLPEKKELEIFFDPRLTSREHLDEKIQHVHCHSECQN